MTKERVLYILIGVLFTAYTVMEYNAPEPMTWIATFDENDTNPYGSKLLYDRLSDIFTEPPRVSYSPLALDDDQEYHQLIITNSFRPSSADSAAIAELLGLGKTIFIVADYYREDWLYGYGLWTSAYDLDLDLLQQDTTTLVHASGDYLMPGHLGEVTIDPDFDGDWEVLVSIKYPVVLSTQAYGGELIISTVPLLFTNYGLLFEKNHQLLSALLSRIPDEPVSYNRYFKAGRRESGSPIRYFLSQPALRWSVYLALGTLAMIIFFGAFRKTPVVPLPESNDNATVEFARTLGGLYHREANHKAAGKKLVTFFYTSLNEKYYIKAPFDNDKLCQIAMKTGVSKEDVTDTFKLIRQLGDGTPFGETDLSKLYRYIRKFDAIKTTWKTTT